MSTSSDAKYFKFNVVVAAGFPEKVNNGTFDNTDHWTVGAGLTIIDGHLHCNYPWNEKAIQTGANMISELEVSHNYTLEFDVSNSTGVGINFSVWDDGTGNVFIEWTDFANGHHSVNFSTPATLPYGTGFLFNFHDANGGDIDNISIKER